MKNVRGAWCYQVTIGLWEDKRVPYQTLIFIFSLYFLLSLKHTHTTTQQDVYHIPIRSLHTFSARSAMASDNRTSTSFLYVALKPNLPLHIWSAFRLLSFTFLPPRSASSRSFSLRSKCDATVCHEVRNKAISRRWSSLMESLSISGHEPTSFNSSSSVIVAITSTEW